MVHDAVSIEDIYNKTEEFPFFVRSIFAPNLKIKIIDRYKNWWLAETFEGRIVVLEGDRGEWLQWSEGEL